MADLPIPISPRAGGVSRDYVAIFADLLRLLPHWCPEWTYQGDDDVGTALLQVLSYLGDHFHHRADVTLRDLKPGTTIYRTVLVELAEWLGYFARRPTCAQTTVTLSLSAPLAGNLTIPKGTQLAADLTETVYFETQDPVTINAGQLSVSVAVIEGRTATEQSLGLASGKVFERFNLTASNIVFNWADTDLGVTVDGVEAQHMRWPRDARPTDLMYWVRVRRDGGLQLRFGDGQYGSLLRAGSPVQVTFRQGGGVKGRVAKNSIKRVVSTVTFEGAPVVLTCTNATRAIGGLAEENLEEIRQAAPAFFRTQDRAVTIEDYEIYARTTPGVFRAKAVASGVNGVILYIVPEGAEAGDVLTPTLKSAVLASLDKRKMATDSVSVVQATLVPIDVDLEVFSYATERNSVVRERVRDAFLDTDRGLLAFSVNELGKHLRQSDMVNVVEDIEGVDYLNVLKYTRRPSIYWVTRVGNAEVTDAGITVTANAREQIWTLYFTDATHFTVTGSLSGLQVRQGTLGAAYSDDNSEFSLTIEAGTLAMAEGDRGTISVSRLAYNIRLAAKEFPVAGTVTVRVFGGIN